VISPLTCTLDPSRPDVRGAEAVERVLEVGAVNGVGFDAGDGAGASARVCCLDHILPPCKTQIDPIRTVRPNSLYCRFELKTRRQTNSLCLRNLEPERRDRIGADPIEGPSPSTIKYGNC